MKKYPQARGLFTAWLLAQQQRSDLVGELAQAVSVASTFPVQMFRIKPWREWATAHDLTEEHVEAAFSEYCHVPLVEKYKAYDQYVAARSVSSVSSNTSKTSEVNPIRGFPTIARNTRHTARG